MKNLSTKIEEGLIKIYTLSMLINRKTDMCVFISDMGHVEKLELRIPKNRKEYLEKQIEVEISYANKINRSWDIDSDYRLETIEETIKVLEDILKNKKINYDYLEPVYEEIISHYLIPNT